MSRVRDAWYVRLPSGQEIKAKSTASVLHHINNGTIPKSSRARRSREEEWMLLEWHAEFTEAITGVTRPREPENGRPTLAPTPAPEPLTGLAARLDPLQLRTVGVRGLWEDLIAALDSTFVSGKLTVAAVAGAMIALVWSGIPWFGHNIFSAFGIELVGDERVSWDRFFRALAAVLGIVIFAWANGLLARMTHMELSTMRRVRLGAAARGYFGLGVRLALAYLITVGGAYLLITLMRWLPTQIYDLLKDRDLPAWLVGLMPSILSVAGLVIEVILWLLIGLAWLLAPVLAGEEFDLFDGLREWGSLIRSHFHRIVLAETLTFALGALIAVPILAPVLYAVTNFYPHLPPPLRDLAIGLACTGFLAFMAVANVFIYLDVKYEHS